MIGVADNLDSVDLFDAKRQGCRVSRLSYEASYRLDAISAAVDASVKEDIGASPINNNAFDAISMLELFTTDAIKPS